MLNKCPNGRPIIVEMPFIFPALPLALSLLLFNTFNAWHRTTPPSLLQPVYDINCLADHFKTLAALAAPSSSFFYNSFLCVFLSFLVCRELKPCGLLGLTILLLRTCHGFAEHLFPTSWEGL